MISIYVIDLAKNITAVEKGMTAKWSGKPDMM
jgi:hypothetical protein